MNQKRVKKFIFVGVLFLLFFILVLSTFFFFRNSNKTISARVIGVGEGYVILETDQEDYIYRTQENYEEGTHLSLKVLQEDSDEYPVLIEKGEVLEVYPSESVSMSGSADIVKDEVSNDFQNSTIEPSFSESFNVLPENSLSTESSSDEAVIAYFEEVDTFSGAGKENMIKEGFVTAVDFLFYQGTIRGVRLADITMKTKFLVMKYVLKLDQKIEEYFPGYKESISKTTKKLYTSVKERIIILYLNTTASICKNHGDLCEMAKNDFQSLKDSFGFTWQFLKNLAGTGVANLKEWYEVFSGK